MLTTNQKTERASAAVSRAVSELDTALAALDSVRASDAEADRCYALALTLKHLRSRVAVIAMSVTAVAVRVSKRHG